MELGAVTPPPDSTDAVRRRRNRRRAVVVLLCGVGAVSVALYRGRLPLVGTPEGPRDSAVGRPARIIPDSVRIKVEVINATDTRGLGRLATAWLRDQGFDVVATTTSSEKDRRDSSLVLDRSGHPAWAVLAGKAMGGARTEARPDSLRYLDLTVLVGRSWRAPPQSLYP